MAMRLLILTDGEWEDYGTMADQFPIPHYFCPCCGEEWLCLVEENPTRHGRKHQAIHYNCLSCGGGSLLDYRGTLLPHLPYPALIRELNLITQLGAYYDWTINITDNPSPRN